MVTTFNRDGGGPASLNSSWVDPYSSRTARWSYNTDPLMQGRRGSGQVFGINGFPSAPRSPMNGNGMVGAPAPAPSEPRRSSVVLVFPPQPPRGGKDKGKDTSPQPPMVPITPHHTTGPVAIPINKKKHQSKENRVKSGVNGDDGHVIEESGDANNPLSVPRKTSSTGRSRILSVNSPKQQPMGGEVPHLTVIQKVREYMDNDDGELDDSPTKPQQLDPSAALLNTSAGSSGSYPDQNPAPALALRIDSDQANSSVNSSIGPCTSGSFYESRQAEGSAPVVGPTPPVLKVSRSTSITLPSSVFGARRFSNNQIVPLNAPTTAPPPPAPLPPLAPPQIVASSSSSSFTTPLEHSNTRNLSLHHGNTPSPFPEEVSDDTHDQDYDEEISPPKSGAPHGPPHHSDARSNGRNGDGPSGSNGPTGPVARGRSRHLARSPSVTSRSESRSSEVSFTSRSSHSSRSSGTSHPGSVGSGQWGRRVSVASTLQNLVDELSLPPSPSLENTNEDDLEDKPTVISASAGPSSSSRKTSSSSRPRGRSRLLSTFSGGGGLPGSSSRDKRGSNASALLTNSSGSLLTTSSGNLAISSVQLAELMNQVTAQEIEDVVIRTTSTISVAPKSVARTSSKNMSSATSSEGTTLVPAPPPQEDRTDPTPNRNSGFLSWMKGRLFGSSSG